MNLGEIGRGGVEWIGLARNKDQGTALVNTVMNIRVQKYLEFLEHLHNLSVSKKKKKKDPPQLR
jgi:hypothetical protein